MIAQNQDEISQDWAKGIKYSRQVPHDANMMVSRCVALIHNLIFPGLDLIDPVDDMEIQSTDTQNKNPPNGDWKLTKK